MMAAMKITSAKVIQRQTFAVLRSRASISARTPKLPRVKDKQRPIERNTESLRLSMPKIRKDESRKSIPIPEDLKRPGGRGGGKLFVYAETKKALEGIPDVVNDVVVIKRVTGKARPAG
jgi:hypothetical protein